MSEYTPTTKDVREVWIYAQDITHDEGEDFHGAEFDRWLAAHDAEVQAGVVAEEPEWEYGVKLHKPLLPPKPGDNIGSGGAVVPTTPHRTLKGAEHMAELNPSYIPTYFTRRPAGPWLPVEN